MRSNLLARSARFGLSSLMLLTLAAPAWTQEHEGFAKQGGYVGVSGLMDFTFDGKTFDGATYYKEVDGEEIVILPKLDTRNMFRGILGFRGEKGAFELSYERSHRNGTFLDMSGEATFQAVNADGRAYLFTRHRIQPHLLAGASMPWLVIKDGGFLNEDVGNARFRGYGVNTEAGVTVYLHPQMGVSAGYAYRIMWFDRVTGVTDKLYELRPRFRETSGSVIITGLFTF